MEYVQQVLVHVAAAKLGDARTLFDALEAHRRDLRGLRGFVSMSVSRSSEPGGDVLVNVETRWKDAGALDEYLSSARNAQSIIRDHAEITVPDTLNVRRLEAMDVSGPSKSTIVTERFFTSLALPLVIVAIGLAIVYGLSRVYLEIGAGGGSTTLAIVIAGGIVLVAWYFAQNRTASVLQMGAAGAAAIALLVGGTVWAEVDDRYPPKDGFERDHVEGGEPTEPAGGETPSPGGANVIELDDNVIVFNGAESPTITAAAGTDVTFEVSNVGNALHNVHIAASGSYAQAFCSASGEDPCSDPARILGGDDGSITFNLPAGTYDFRCDFHTAEMTGTLEVQ